MAAITAEAEAGGRKEIGMVGSQTGARGRSGALAGAGTGGWKEPSVRLRVAHAARTPKESPQEAGTPGGAPKLGGNARPLLGGENRAGGAARKPMEEAART